MRTIRRSARAAGCRSNATVRVRTSPMAVPRSRAAVKVPDCFPDHFIQFDGAHAMKYSGDPERWLRALFHPPTSGEKLPLTQKWSGIPQASQTGFVLA